MPDRPTIEVAEYGSAKLARSDLTENDLVVLSGISGGLVQCTATVGGWELRVGAACGVIELDRCRVAVRPKLMPDGAAVVSWIGYAMAAPVTLDDLRGWTVQRGGLRDVIVAALVDECTALLRGGLHRDYRRRAAVDTVLRGRLDISRQVSRRFGHVDRLFLHRFDRETDVWENVVCRVALDAASRVADSPELRRSARDLAARFPAGAADPAVARRRLATARYHRMNARYRPSHLWAGLLLGAGGVSDMLITGPWNAGSMLIKMSVLWERLVQRLCHEISGPWNDSGSHPPQIVVREQGRAQRPFLPDAVIVRHEAGRAIHLPVDAKYKNYGANAISHDDVHQLLTYAAAFRLPDAAEGSALLVHPVIGPGADRRVDVRAGAARLGSVVVAGLDTTGTPAEAVHSVRRASALLQTGAPESIPLAGLE